jgi:hypothetical protein
MKNRYVITLLHWFCSVVLGSFILFGVSGFELDVLYLSLIFASGGSIGFFLFSLIIIPRILKFIPSKPRRAIVLSVYSGACCFGGFVLLVAMDFVTWNEVFQPEKETVNIFTYGIVSHAFYAFMLAVVVSSVLWALVYKENEPAVSSHGVLDQL